MEIYEEPEIYEHLIYEDEAKQNRIMLVVNEFRGIEYISVRKYYMDFYGEWMPSNQGCTFPIDLDSTKAMFVGLAEILSLAESREVIEKYFGDIIKETYSEP